MISGRIASRSLAVVLAAATLLPVGSASADPVPPDSGPQAELAPQDSGPQAEPVPQDPEPQTGSVSRDAEPQTGPDSRDAEPQTGPDSRNSEPQAAPVSPDSEPQAELVPPDSAAQADPVPSDSGPPHDLVPGMPLGLPPLWQTDTPDQALAPEVYTPTPEEDAVEPEDAPREAYDSVEYVDPIDALGGVKCSEETGPRQRQVEKWLKLPVDGEQSAADCRAIRAFQKKHGIKPAIGFAGPLTWATMQLVDARKNPNADKKCPVRAYRVACVDLDRQLTWVQHGKKVVFGPAPIRSGREGYGTRTGWHTVYWRHKNHVSTLYKSRMPYSQFFSGGQAFHGVYGNIFSPVGSMGCVNMRLDEARRLWRVLKQNDRVYVWGHRQEA
ncbi:L,D-transpeptidase family protein [Streptomyces sp. NPDC093591]|uniref:L,D-transpeptidase family protein n=1 Tax=Streptomyces sp. NPDC093591 TaxID=3366044 RepID=UPI00381E370D